MVKESRLTYQKLDQQIGSSATEEADGSNAKDIALNDASKESAGSKFASKKLAACPEG